MDNVQDRSKQIFDRIVLVVKNMLRSSEEEGERKIPEMSGDTDIFNDLGIDSVEMMDLMGLIEKEFNVTIDTEQLAGKHTLGNIVQYVMKLLQRA